LGRSVIRLAEIASRTGGGADIDDLSRARGAMRSRLLLGGLAQERRCSADNAKGSRQVDINHRLPLGIAHLVKRAVPVVARIVHQNVELAESLLCGVYWPGWKVWR